MLDIKRVRKETQAVQEGLQKRGGAFPIENLIARDEERRAMIAAVEEKKARQNQVSKEVPALKKAGEDPAPLFKEMKVLSTEIKELDERVREADEEIRELLLAIPNIPHESVPVGQDDGNNVVVRTWGEPRQFDFEPKAHWDLGVDLDILDFERATKISGARFSVFKGPGARLERSLMNFMLNLHTGEHGYREMWVPVMMNRASMIGTGQLPKFVDDMFHIPQKDMYMAPTAEVPVTNLHRDEILPLEALPIHYTGYTPCFRAEAGSAGRDTRGLIRNHQFDKVELVKFVEPKTSYDELEALTRDAERVLQLLEIPYRVVALCTGDLGFSSAKTYDIEVWMPSYNRYVEISSCSNFESYQARRANIRYRNAEGKVEYLHTLNGSGIAIGRAFAAVLENYQNEDGSVTLPKALQGLMGQEKIEK